jgi:hypothetical protein
MARFLLLRVDVIDAPPDRGEVLAGDLFGRRVIDTTPFVLRNGRTS